MVDKDAKMRDMKRQNVLLQSKIKLLEEEMENLHEKIDFTLKERNKLRREVQINGIPPTSEPISRAISPTASTISTQYANFMNLPGTSSSTNLIEPFKTSSSFYTQSNIYSQSWDRFKLHELKLNSQDSHFEFSSNTFNGNSNGLLSASKTLRT